MRIYHRTRVSNFRPVVARAIVNRYSNEGDTVLDFAAGYGGRLLGTVILKRHYLGIDAARAQVAGLNGNFDFLHAREIARLSPSERENYEERAFRYWRQHGFPNPHYTESQIVKAYRTFAASRNHILSPDGIIRWSPLGLGLANSFQPHMWATKCERFRTPLEVFNSDHMLRDCIHRAIKYWKKGRPVDASGMRSILSTYKNTKRVSNFRPTAARAIIENYSRDGDVILDPAAGYGGRLLGCLPLSRKYIGIEPSNSTYLGLSRMERRLRHLVSPDASIALINAPAEESMLNIKSSSVDLVILSPPYFARERYGTAENQSWVRYPNYSLWKEEFLCRLLREIHRVLKPNGILALNVANTEAHKIADDAKDICIQYFHLVKECKLLIGSVPYHRNGQRGGYRCEPLFVFRKDMRASSKNSSMRQRKHHG